MISEKEARTAIHKALREHFQGRLVSTTAEAENGDQSLVISWKGPGGQNKERGGTAKGTSPPSHFRNRTILIIRDDSATAKSRQLGTTALHPLYATKNESRSARRPLVALSGSLHSTARSRHLRNEGQTRGDDSTMLHQARNENDRGSLACE